MTSTSVPFYLAIIKALLYILSWKEAQLFCGRKLLFHIIPVGNWKIFELFFLKDMIFTEGTSVFSFL